MPSIVRDSTVLKCSAVVEKYFAGMVSASS